MKQSTSLTLTLCLASTVALSSCGSFKALKADQVKVDPNTLVVTGNRVPARVHVAFPAKWFPKKGTLTLTPVLRYNGGEKWGQAYTYQGEKIYGNNPVIFYKNGSNVVLDFSVPYVAGMERSNLFLTLKGKKGSKTITLPELKIAQGTITTEALATLGGIMPAEAPDGFERIIKEAYDTDIMFQIQRANVRGSELNKEDVKDWKNLVKLAQETPRQEVSVEVQSYASPDGGRELNEKLSQAREKNTTNSLKQAFRSAKMKDVAIDAHYTAQDWEGFKQLVEKSDLQDKDLVLRVLSMYPDPEQREREIKNISAVFGKLADEVLPKLRRSRLIANIQIIGKSDAEISELLAKAPAQLSVEEMLHAANLVSTSDEKMSVYKLVIAKFPEDYRAYNNIGALFYQQGNLPQADFWFNQAAKREKNAISDLNLGLIELSKGNIDQATNMIASATSVPELGQALGYLYLKQGEYAKAATSFGQTISNNAAVAHILNQDYTSALSILKQIAQPTATTYLLKAIVGARTNDQGSVLANLKEALRLDSSLASKLADNMEFARYASLPAFSSLMASAGR